MRRTEFSELAIGHNERPEGSQTIESLVTMLFRSVLVNRSIGNGSISSAKLLCLPDEILKQVAFVFRQKQKLGFFDHNTDILDELTALRRKPGRWLGKRPMGEGRVHSHIDLSILYRM